MYTYASILYSLNRQSVTGGSGVDVDLLIVNLRQVLLQLEGPTRVNE